MDNINAIQAIASGFNLDHIPAQDEVLRHFGSSLWTLAGAPFDTPDINVGFTNGVQTAWFLTTSNIRGWSGPRKLYINPATYLRIFNTSPAGIQNLSYDGEQEKYIRGVNSNVISGFLTLAPGLAGIVRPPINETWHITDFGSSQWVGIAPVGQPDILVEIGDGVNWAIVCDGLNARLFYSEDMGIDINNSIYLRLTNTSGLQADLAWSGIKSKQYESGASSVKSNVAAVLAGGVINIAPVSTREEWMVTGIYSSVLIGVAPDQFPDVNVENNNGVLTSLKARNSDAPTWLHHPNILVSSTNYLTVTDTSGAGGVLGYSAYRTRM